MRRMPMLPLPLRKRRASPKRTIDRLNEFDDLDDCIIYISENYDWNPSSDGVRFLIELLERKLS